MTRTAKNPTSPSPGSDPFTSNLVTNSRLPQYALSGGDNVNTPSAECSVSVSLGMGYMCLVWG